MTTELSDHARELCAELKKMCDLAQERTGRFTHAAVHMFTLHEDGKIHDDLFVTTFEVADPVQLMPTHDAVVDAMENYEERKIVYPGH